MIRDDEVRRLANGAWNKLNFALSLVDGNGPKDQLIELLEDAREACDMIVMGGESRPDLKGSGAERMDARAKRHQDIIKGAK
jgi:hypothetical protein